MRESVIEKYFHRQVEQHGGTTRKFASPGRPNVPDRIAIWPCTKTACVHFIELKAPGKKARPGQAREHVRLQKLGAVVLVLDSIEKVDAYVRRCIK